MRDDLCVCGAVLVEELRNCPACGRTAASEGPCPQYDDGDDATRLSPVERPSSGRFFAGLVVGFGVSSFLFGMTAVAGTVAYVVTAQLKDTATATILEPIAKTEPIAYSTPIAIVEATPIAKVEATPIAKAEATPVAKVEATPVAKVEATPIMKEKTRATPKTTVARAAPVVRVEATPAPTPIVKPAEKAEATPSRDELLSLALSARQKATPAPTPEPRWEPVEEAAPAPEPTPAEDAGLDDFFDALAAEK